MIKSDCMPYNNDNNKKNKNKHNNYNIIIYIRMII